MSCSFQRRVFIILLFSISTIAQVPPGAATKQKATVAAKAANPQVALALTLTADNLNPPPRQSVHFTATWNREVSGLVYVFDWGDTQTTNGTDPQADHVFSEPGTYTVHLTAQFALRAFASQTPGITSNDLVINVAQPRAKTGKKLSPLTVIADLSAPLPNRNVHFTVRWDQRVYGPAYVFDWGDGQSNRTTRPDAYHAYAAPHTYTVRVSAKGLANDQDISAKSNILTINVATPPATMVATLRVNNSKVHVGEPVTFTARIDPPTPSVEYHFDFGDSSAQNSSSNEVTYPYHRAGNYQATVTASTGGRGRTVSSSPIALTISPPKVLPRVKVEVLSKDLISGKDLLFIASLEPPVPVRQYQFNWGDGLPSEAVAANGRATHRYAQKGSYNLVVTALTPKTYPAPLENNSLTLIISKPGWQFIWPPTLGELLLLAAVIAAMIYAPRIVRLVINKLQPPAGHPGLRATGSPDGGDHTIAYINPSLPYVSFTLKPGMDSAEHEIVFPERSAASD